MNDIVRDIYLTMLYEELKSKYNVLQSKHKLGMLERERILKAKTGGTK